MITRRRGDAENFLNRGKVELAPPMRVGRDEFHLVPFFEFSAPPRLRV